MSPAEMLTKLREIAPDLTVYQNPSNRADYMALMSGVEDGSRHGVLSSLCGHGPAPDDAMRELWAEVTKSTRLVIDAYQPTRREVVWCDLTNRFLPYGFKRDASHLLSTAP